MFRKFFYTLSLLCLLSLGFVSFTSAQTNNTVITSAKTVNPTTVELQLNNGRHIIIDFYADHIFRLFIDSTAKQLRAPEAKPEAQILVDQPRKPVTKMSLTDRGMSFEISTGSITVRLDKASSQFSILTSGGETIVQSVEPVSFEAAQTTVKLKESANEYFYGGGVQNGRFSHKGRAIAIENQNSWTDGGVASPNPFYWSTNGYGVMGHTFRKGKYDFGLKEKGVVTLYHETNYLDLFFMVNNGAVALLNDFYQLTGHPVLLPKFAFYQGHLNAYNRDYWKEDTTGILFEDGKKYKESQKDNGGIKESLNGELANNYRFSARAVIDRYKRNDMPLGWVLPNDGYGAGYGQTGTLDSNVLNLKNFGDYARKNGVEIGLWTQSDLHPKAGVSALLQRDIVKEVRDAGVRVLKTDVAWVGAGYSFGLNGVADVARITSQYGKNARPFIISLDGWAGTQRYAGIWSGDQTGGQWEYIRFHIPTYIGSGLSGNPNISSDMDGIFGGKNIPVNVRDFQWKTFTPMQLNMDGWGSNPKYPEALGEPATSINRNYLKWKSELMPYTYSIAREAISGWPMIRAMFLDEATPYTLSAATRYQFMYGPSFLIAPIYKDTRSDKEGNDIRHGIYLPKGTWIDYFTGEQYEGGRVINYFNAPLWKLPVLVKPGAIIPLANANNNVHEINKELRIYELYPAGVSAFTEYDDDGVTEAYRGSKGTTTEISMNAIKDKVSVVVNTAKGNFDGFVKDKETVLKFNVSQPAKKITARVGGKKVKLKQVASADEFNKQSNVYFYNAAPEFNRFATAGSDFSKQHIARNPQVWVKLATTDISKSKVEVTLSGFLFHIDNQFRKATGVLSPVAGLTVIDSNAKAFSLQPSWKKTDNADFYEVQFNDMLYSHILDTSFLLEELQPESGYSFQVRAVNKTGPSAWAAATGKTKMNPLQFAIKGIAGYSTAASQGGEGLNKLFDFDEDNNWHTQYGKNAIPLDLVLDLKSVNQLDKLQYLPRSSGFNGVILKGKIYYSMDRKSWTEAGMIAWKRSNEIKEFTFTTKPTARYVKLEVTEGVGNFGSGREIYVFKVPGSASYIPGDINNDGKIDHNDLTSYTNYTGLRKGDGDFEGYISNGDINKNNLIDAFDISNVTTQLDGGVSRDSAGKLSGKLVLASNKAYYKKGDNIEITIKGHNLDGVNALSFALPYDASKYEYIGTQTTGTGAMENLTYDRLHTNGTKALYPAFVNVGKKELLNGSAELFIIKMKAKQDLTFDLKATDGILVGKDLDTVTF
ncbi:glycoside hydrolase family 31 protein [Niabella yanshanensis]|uniref:Glycoside hydrolase family 31 protein n=1 Tax=Niabella yanshanensis TaxID=577386 RepID=A0ABZ0W1C9_9BACT|nr:TIM-barrel domain-containing protein [Niabella yanshanensis]WQD37012.1 glycoside hydrolase family 31 protein [Niabella yanshanensis]